MAVIYEASIATRARLESGSRATPGRAGTSTSRARERARGRSARGGRARGGARAVERVEGDAGEIFERRSRAIEDGEASGRAVGRAWRRSLVGALAVCAVCAATVGGGVGCALADDADAVDGVDDARGAPVVEEATTTTAAAATAAPSVAPPPKEEQKAEEGKKTDRRGRMRELQDLRSELEIKELELEGTENELQKSDQTVQVLQQELELKTKLYELMKTERDKAIEESKLASGLCAQVGGF